MIDNLPKRFYVASVANCDEGTINVPLQAGCECFFVTPKTLFIGAVDNKAAYDSVKRPGLSVNVWVEGSHVVYASPNYK